MDGANGRKAHQGWTKGVAEIDARIDAALSTDLSVAAPVLFVRKGGLDGALEALGDAALVAPTKAFAEAIGFSGASGQILILPGEDGKPRLAALGCGDRPEIERVGAAPGALPETSEGWRFVEGAGPDAEAGAREWLLGAYRFERYKGASRRPARLAAKLSARTRAEVAGCFLARDLVNTPAGDLGPDALEEAVGALAAAHGAKIETTIGEDLLDKNFPMIHAVGRAGIEAPRLIDLRWSGSKAKKKAPQITLVGKGVCFDTGGLDIKPSRAMRDMKKDMGGSAAAIAAAAILMRCDAPIKLRLLVPAVENAIGPAAFRPGDVLESRAGLTVEVENTDAEGRLVLADALSLACEEEPDLLIDFATLTGAARVALGPELPPLYATDDDLAAGLLEAGARMRDPLWRMPLHASYDADLSSSVADVMSASSGGFAGSITAALFLKRFVGKGGAAPAWAHLDIYAWNPKERPGRPRGGEAQGARAVADYIMGRYGGGK